MKNLYIIGAGGFGREVAWCVERINEVTPTWKIKGFIDDDETKWGAKEDEYLVLGGCEYLKQQNDAYAVCAVGNVKVRKQIIEKLSNSGVRFATIVDPSVILSKRVSISSSSQYTISIPSSFSMLSIFSFSSFTTAKTFTPSAQSLLHTFEPTKPFEPVTIAFFITKPLLLMIYLNSAC